MINRKSTLFIFNNHWCIVPIDNIVYVHRILQVLMLIESFRKYIIIILKTLYYYYDTGYTFYKFKTLSKLYELFAYKSFHIDDYTFKHIFIYK